MTSAGTAVALNDSLAHFVAKLGQRPSPNILITGDNNEQQEVSVRSPFTKCESDEDDESSSNEAIEAYEIGAGSHRKSTVAPGIISRRRQRQQLQEQQRRQRRRHASKSHNADSPLNFEIANSRGKIARICFFKRAYKLGETVIAAFDFSGQE